MGAAIQKAHPAAEIQLQPGGRGDFIVTVDGKKLWDKRAMDDEFPEHDQILSQLR
ncbi:MAG: Rdx family protein [Planctomycetes bacterium]|nr:Rdx family protein [Planctomycetota bacterium]